MAAKKSPKKTTAPAKPKPARTASGKKADSARLDSAARESVRGLQQRMAEGMRASGQFPAVKDEVLPRAATDDSIGDFSWALTEDAKLLQYGGPKSDFRTTDPWRVMRITS